MNDFFIGIETVRQCNLRCAHCFRADLDKVSEIPFATVEKILDQAVRYHRPHIALTGGETTLHTRFSDILNLIIDKGFTFHYVTNGFNYDKIYRKLYPIIDHPQWIGVSVSMDGATAETHDAIRGPGSFQRALMTVVIGLMHKKEVVVQMVVHRGNAHELEAMAVLCSKVGASRLHIAHMQPTPHAVANHLLHSPDEFKMIERDIRDLQGRFRMPIVLSAGFYDLTSLAHCRFLKLSALNIDHQGRLTTCCQLSNLEGSEGEEDVIADLNVVSLEHAHMALLKKYQELFTYRLEKQQNGKAHDLDNFHCYTCMKHQKKVEWMSKFPENEWVKADPYFAKKETL